MGRFCGDRHQGRVLVVFNDSHVEEVELPNLWTLHWHKEWETPATLPSPPTESGGGGPSGPSGPSMGGTIGGTSKGTGGGGSTGGPSL